VAGQIIVSSIKTDSDNSISFVANTGATIFSANLASGLSASSFGDNTITSDKIVSVANTKIDGNIVSSQITSVANTQLTGTVTNAQVGSSVYEGIGMRNRIINGDMRIDQRNAGASVTITTNFTYTLDRWVAGSIQASKFSVQQSSTAPAGFSNSILITSLSAYTVVSSDYFNINQFIEGFNFVDFGFGTANARSVTISFWVRSSLTGTFGGALANSAGTRAYPFTYTISSADTFEYKTVTIAGDTSGTWVGATNGIGARLWINLGAGATFSGTANAWSSSNLVAPTGAVSVVGTNGATFYITGVQLEVGSVATPFERRPFGTELALCQRYFSKLSAATSNAYVAFGANVYTGSGSANGFVKYPNTMRASPTLSYGGTISFGRGIALANITGVGTTYAGTDSVLWQPSGLTGGADKDAGIILSNNDTSAFIAFSAEL